MRRTPISFRDFAFPSRTKKKHDHSRRALAASVFSNMKLLETERKEGDLLKQRNIGNIAQRQLKGVVEGLSAQGQTHKDELDCEASGGAEKRLDESDETMKTEQYCE